MISSLVGRSTPILIGMLLLSGCQGTPCVAYLDAQETCYADASEINPLAESSTYCRDFTEESDPYFECLADAYKDADCSTPDGFDAAIAAATNCSLE